VIYGLYLSASGVITSSFRQDVIANNIANSETVGFKKDLSLIQQRLTADQERMQSGGIGAKTDPLLENIGGGLFVGRSLIDSRQGEFEPTGNSLDVGIQGKGYFAVTSNGQLHLTRNGEFLVDRQGNLVLSNDVGQNVLDIKQSPIHLSSTSPVEIAPDGTVTQNGKAVAQIGAFDVPDPTRLQKEGGSLLSAPPNVMLTTATPQLRSKFVERSNVDAATELADLMDAQRQLEANANMIKVQDETLDKLVNDVGKVG
jgi:flagellar basal-body rod protein FlgF